jgi:FixJ family two-component response regulator
MPGMTGIELQRRLVANGHHVPIIFMSGVSNEKIRVDLLKTGAVGF